MNNKFLQISIYIFIFIFLMSVLGTIIARYTPAKGERGFYKIVQKPRYNLAIGMFYDCTKYMRKGDPELYCKIQKTKEIFKKTSFAFEYDDADLMFVCVNVGEKSRYRNYRCKRGCSKYFNQYGFKEQFDVGSVPKFILFRDGEPLKDETGNIASLTGFLPTCEFSGDKQDYGDSSKEFISISELKALIDSNFNNLLARNRKRNADIRQRCREKNMDAWAAWGPYWGPGWGGYWGGCGWGGCGLGYGWGGCGWSGCGGYRRCGGCRRRRGCCGRRCR